MNEFTGKLNRLENSLANFPQKVAILAADLFDQNFEKQSFFGIPWKPSKYVETRRSGGKLLIGTGRLRRSIKYQLSGNKIIFKSDAPYAEIHNEGGTIKHPGGTAYFKKKGETIWVSNRKAAGKNYPRTKPHNIEIPQRQFIGSHPQLTKEIEVELDKLFKKAGF
jgi:phage gpG-like protein